MTRLVPRRDRKTGRTMWSPAEPPPCSCGHEGYAPSWGGCPACRTPCLLWKCLGCLEVQAEDEHVCRDGPLPASALRGA